MIRLLWCAILSRQIHRTIVYMLMAGMLSMKEHTEVWEQAVYVEMELVPPMREDHLPLLPVGRPRLQVTRVGPFSKVCCCWAARRTSMQSRPCPAIGPGFPHAVWLLGCSLGFADAAVSIRRCAR